MEELNRGSLPGGDDPATMAAWAQARDLVDHDVVDVNGVRLGRVTRCFAEEGSLVRCDVTLSENAKGLVGAERDVASFPPHWIARIDEERVWLSKAGEQLVRPDDPRPVGASDDLRGAKGQPRRVR